MNKNKYFAIWIFLCIALAASTVEAARKTPPVPIRRNISSAIEKHFSINGNNLSVDDLARVEAAAKQISLEGKQMEQQANKIKSELDVVNKKMIEAAKRIQKGEDEVLKKQSELEKLQEHLDLSEKNFNSEHGMLVDTVTALQILALHPSEAILIQPLSPVEVMRSSILLRGSVHVLKDRAETIRQNIEDISNQKEEIAKRLQDLEKQNKVLSQQQTEMEELSKQKTQMFSQLSTQSKEAKRQAQQLASQAQDLRDLLEKLELQKRQQAEKERLARAQAAEKMRQQNRLTNTADNKVDTPKNINFSKARGLLTRPARGSIITSFHQELSKGVVSNGIDIKTASKAQVVAPYDGTIIFAGPFKNFANLVIIDHGEGYTSLLSGLNETYTEVGQLILAGEPVGVMPKESSNKLHMEIRKNNHPLNPVEWISNK